MGPVIDFRAGSVEDVPTILSFIRALAEYERLAHEVEATEDLLRETLFGERRGAEVIFAVADGKEVGFALFFHNFSTFLGRPGLYLEDLFVLPEARGKGVGKALLRELARIAVARGCGRFEWWVLDWNEPVHRVLPPPGRGGDGRVDGDAGGGRGVAGLGGLRRHNGAVRIGVFDSGLGGLSIAQAIARRLPSYDLLYLGDTMRVPYGGRSQEAIHGFVSEALAYLFAQDCHLVVLACNTASAEALRRAQQEYLPRCYPERRVLGVVIPAAEAVAAMGARRVGVLATRSTAASGAYEREIARQAPGAEVRVVPAPLLVPLVENDGLRYVDPILEEYLGRLGEVDCVVLGCTHYGLLKDRVRARVGVPVIVQEEVVPSSLVDYLRRHPEHDARLGRAGERIYRVTDLGPGYEALARTFAGEDVRLERVEL